MKIGTKTQKGSNDEQMCFFSPAERKICMNKEQRTQNQLQMNGSNYKRGGNWKVTKLHKEKELQKLEDVK